MHTMHVEDGAGFLPEIEDNENMSIYITATILGLRQNRWKGTKLILDGIWDIRYAIPFTPWYRLIYYVYNKSSAKNFFLFALKDSISNSKWSTGTANIYVSDAS